MINEIRKIRQLIIQPKYGWFGDYQSWAAASKLCTSYSDRSILDKVRNALLEVTKGNASFERDSVLFYKPDYNWPFLSAILWAFGKSNGNLTIVDFGGSLGSTYFQHRSWLNDLTYTWNVVEQPHFVEEGKKSFEDEKLHFFNTVEEIKENSPTFLVLSSVLAYLPDPYAWLIRLLDLKYDYVFIDRTPLVEGDDRLTIQKTPKEIYDVTYPAWFFQRTKFMEAITKDYEVVAQNACNEKTNFPSEFLGFFLKRKND